MAGLCREVIQVGDRNFECFYVKVIDCDGNEQVWLRGSTVCEFLEYKDVHKTLQRHVDIESKKTYAELVESEVWEKMSTPLNWQPSTVFVNEIGFYELVFRSNKKEAKQLLKQVCVFITNLKQANHITLQLHQREVAAKDETIQQLVTTVVKCNENLMIANTRAHESNTALALANQKLIESTERSDALAKQAMELAKCAVVKPPSPELEQTFRIFQLRENLYSFNRSRRTSQRLLEQRLRKQHPYAQLVLVQDPIPHGTNILPNVKNMLRENNIKYKAKANR